MLKPYTELETIEIMIVETQNQLTKCTILDKLYNRLALSGSETYRQAQGQNQSSMRNFKKTLDTLISIRDTNYTTDKA